MSSLSETAAGRDFPVDVQVMGEQSRVFFEQARSSAVGNAVFAGFAVALLWGGADPLILLGWFGAVIVHSLVRWTMYRRYDPETRDRSYIER